MFDTIVKNEERVFHNSLYGSKGKPRKAQSRFYNAYTQKTLHNYALVELGDIKGKSVLYYGCGTRTDVLLFLASSGASVTAIDISEEAINKINDFIKKRDLNATVRALRMDCEKLDFPEKAFDRVFGGAIIHHLDMKRAVPEIRRVLKPNGKAVFIEPLGINPAINLYRYLTPSARTKNEHPLNLEDFSILRNSFRQFFHKSFFFVSILPMALNFTSKKRDFTKKIIESLLRLDDFILRTFPFLRKFAWCTVITLVR